MTRFAFALVASLALAALTCAADLPAGTWAANVDGEKGDFVITQAKDGKFSGSLLGTDVSGTWNGRTLTFQKGNDTYEAHLVGEPADKGKTKWTLTGTRATTVRDFKTRAGTVHVTKTGWYAQLTADTPDPTGTIKAEVRGVLVYEKGSAYIRVVRRVGETTEEMKVWVGVEDWKAAKAALSALDGKEVVATGALAQLVRRDRDSTLPDGALYFTGKFEIKAADPPK